MFQFLKDYNMLQKIVKQTAETEKTHNSCGVWTLGKINKNITTFAAQFYNTLNFIKIAGGMRMHSGNETTAVKVPCLELIMKNVQGLH